ncbi:MAG: polyprenyl synthetase family protein [Chloroflexi bacterium]|nr:polyprenyl synthetase family protein [Chloroflexota bacterium]
MSEIETHVRAAVLALPEMEAWPQVADLFTPTEGRARFDWQLPVLACRAAGGDPSLALPAAAAIACLQVSIILTDDMLDEDPRGEHHRLGSGRTANLALALQAAALVLVGQAPVPAERRTAAGAALARAALATAAGQELDVQNLRGEESYWRVVRAKSTPFYAAALQIGALLAGADPAVAQGVYDLGVLIGEVIQVYDDLVDAFQAPASPDWLERRNNLALLYAATAAHPQRDRFLYLLARAADPPVLEEAQQILIASGAVSYCVYHLVQRHRTACRLLARLPLADPAPLSDLLASQVQPLANWLQNIGVEVPLELRGETA